MSERVVRFPELSDPSLAIATVLECYAERSTNPRDSIRIRNRFERIDRRLEELLCASIVLISEKHEQAIACIGDGEPNTVIEPRCVFSHSLAMLRCTLD